MVRFTTGEFAQMCGVKKATLFHYDEIGLLRPQGVGGNGYRYYSDKEVFTFELISALKEVGTPLAVIKAYLDQRNPDHFLAALREGQEKLARERRRIERLERLLAHTVATTEGARNLVLGEVRLVPCPEEYLIAHRAAANPALLDRDVFLRVREHSEYCRKRNLTETLPIGLILSRDDLGKDPILERWYFTRTGKKLADPHFQLKPAGTYATLYHRGPYESLAQACCLLKAYLDENNLVAASDVYEEDQLSFLSTDREGDYVLKVSVMVNPPAKPARGYCPRPF